MRVLVTGGAGYIGAHVCKALVRKGIAPVVYDSLVSGYRSFVRGEFVLGDVRDVGGLRKAMKGVDAVIHLAGLIEVERSVREPALFHDVNVGGTRAVIEAMEACGVRRIVFASSGGVYAPSDLPLTEDSPIAPSSPYGETKAECEAMLAATTLHATAFRFFNASGADDSLTIGELHEPETHLIPLAIRAATTLNRKIMVNGCNYPTPDGTCVRDYVHVSDIADAHVAALLSDDGSYQVMNLGAGKGWSVIQVLRRVAATLGLCVPYEIGPRREGDPAITIADPAKAKHLLGWTAHRSVEEIVQSAVAWEAMRSVTA